MFNTVVWIDAAKDIKKRIIIGQNFYKRVPAVYCIFVATLYIFTSEQIGDCISSVKTEQSYLYLFLVWYTTGTYIACTAPSG